jgi:hypothetical protein
MDNWNYDKATAFVESVQDPVSRRLTKLFLDRLVLFVAQKQGYPEAEFDLLFFVRSVTVVTSEIALLRMVMEGNNPDDGWAAIAEAFDKPPFPDE